ncbi:MAG TPA: hypothetical protein ENJ18_18475 [Nannocystis exedens]|nr:hypothetical protein [Nannocystis exedens]
MSNPFYDSAQTILASLDESVANELKGAAKTSSQIAAGIELTIEEVLGLLLVARHIAATDGLSTAESNGMRALLSHYGVPASAQDRLMAVDLGHATDDHVRELVPAGSAKAMYLVNGVATIAARDGLSPEELARIAEIGTKVGLSQAMVDALTAEAEAAIIASIRGDGAMLDKLDKLRDALFRLAPADSAS